jgi:hypothetical protein
MPESKKERWLSIFYQRRKASMSLQSIAHGLLRASIDAVLIALLAVCIASCSTVPGAKDNSGVAATKSTDPTDGKDQAADRRRWSSRVERDNDLDSSGSGPGYYGSFGPRFSW